MRGLDAERGGLFSYVDLEARVPKDHPLRAIRRLVDAALVDLAPAFAALYAPLGRPSSIPPERLVRALLLQAFYPVRSERQLMEQLGYNLLFRWFVGLGIDDSVWDVTVFTKNRDRLLDGDIAKAFLREEHFSVDGKLMIQAWASIKTFRPRDGSAAPPSSGRDKHFDTRGFVAGLRGLNVTPHVARNTTNRRSAIDGRTTRHPGYELSQRARKRIEEAFGWIKEVALVRRARHRGKEWVGWRFTLAAAAYDLVRLPKPLGAAA